MRHFILWILMSGLFLAACQKTPSQMPQNTQEMITLNPLKGTKYRLKVGDRFQIANPVHGSVGIWAEQSIADTTILMLEGSETKYKHPENMKQGMTGGDAATKTFTFRALKVGQTTITSKQIFRGTVEREDVYQITVE